MEGYRYIKIFISGGLDEYKILKYSPFADVFGVGTCISNAPVIDFSMDIVEIDGKPIAKRGKASGSKRLFSCPKCNQTKIMPAPKRPRECQCGSRMKEILVQHFKNGELQKPLPNPVNLRKFVLKELEKVDEI